MRAHFCRLTVLIALAAILNACGSPSAAQPTAAPVVAAPTTAPTTMPTAAPPTVPTSVPTAALEVTDALGRRITLDRVPLRIVSLNPSVTEILFAVGAGPQLVGNTRFCNFPPEAAALPEIGGVTTRTISVEAIVDLTPDLVLAGTASQAPVVEALEELGIPVIVFAPNSFEDVYANIEQAGYLTGNTLQAAEVVTAMRARVDAVTAVVAAVPAAERPTVFWEVFDEPLMTAGPDTFIGQMIDLVGANNIFADAAEDYPQVSAEAIVERNPQVILGPDSHAEKLTPEMVAQRPGWSTIQAVETGQVFLLDADMTSRPGPRLADALEALARALYPPRFP